MLILFTGRNLSKDFGRLAFGELGSRKAAKERQRAKRNSKKRRGLNEFDVHVFFLQISLRTLPFLCPARAG